MDTTITDTTITEAQSGAGEGPLPREWTGGTTSTQIGKAGETLVACSIMLASRGRLTPYMPLADDDGLDLMLLDKLTGKTIPVQVKGRTGTDAATPGLVEFNVRKKTYSTHYGSVLLAVLIDVENVRIGQSWVVPMDKLRDVSGDKSAVLAMRASTLPDSQDRCRPYRCDTVADLVRSLTRMLDEKGAELPV